jgi:hypothetical protein
MSEKNSVVNIFKKLYNNCILCSEFKSLAVRLVNKIPTPLGDRDLRYNLTLRANLNNPRGELRL